MIQIILFEYFYTGDIMRNVYSMFAFWASLIFGFTGTAASAATMKILFEEVGGNVEVTASGSFDLTGLTELDNDSLDPATTAVIYGSYGALTIGPSSYDPTDLYAYDSNTGPPLPLPFVDGDPGIFFADAGTGDKFGLDNISSGDSVLIVPRDYVSLSALAATSIYLGSTFETLSLLPGTYNLSIFNNLVTFTIGPMIDGPSEVPLPAALPLFLCGISILVLVRKKNYCE